MRGDFRGLSEMRRDAIIWQVRHYKAGRINHRQMEQWILLAGWGWKPPCR